MLASCAVKQPAPPPPTTYPSESAPPTGDVADRASPVAVAQLLRSWLGRADVDRFRQTLPVLGVDGSLLGVAADYHPFLRGMRGIARAIYHQVTGERAPAGQYAAPPPGSVVTNPAP